MILLATFVFTTVLSLPDSLEPGSNLKLISANPVIHAVMKLCSVISGLNSMAIG